jgi:hypothetical protein
MGRGGGGGGRNLLHRRALLHRHAVRGESPRDLGAGNQNEQILHILYIFSVWNVFWNTFNSENIFYLIGAGAIMAAEAESCLGAEDSRCRNRVYASCGICMYVYAST